MKRNGMEMISTWHISGMRLAVFFLNMFCSGNLIDFYSIILREWVPVIAVQPDF